MTDYHLWGHLGLVFVPLGGEPSASVNDTVVADEIAARGWITEAYFDPYLVPRVAEFFKRRRLQNGRVGIVGWKDVLPIGVFQQLQNALPDVRFLNADNLMDRIRMIKSPLEIQQNRELWAMAKAAMERFIEALEPGRTQVELAAEATSVLKRGGCRDILVWFDGHLPPAALPVAFDDILEYHMEMCGESGHWCELTVKCVFRDPTPGELRLMESELRAYEEIRKIARPGANLKDLDRTFERVLVEEGWQLADQQILDNGFDSEGLGPHNDFHGQGLDPVEWPLYGLLVQEDAPLEEGMVFSYHPHREVVPAVPITGICDDLLITAGEAERLSGDWDFHWRVMQ